ncbi:molybdopterin molybdotransferase, partial [Flavonifractor plautii]|nr:molybdopterin molybdotransferase [Flavonifractor plautii]
MVTGISLEQAVGLMTGGLSPLPPEALPAVHALGRTLASHVTAPMDHPP